MADRSEYIRLIFKRLAGKVSTREDRLLEDWIHESPDNLETVKKCTYLWRLLETIIQIVVTEEPALARELRTKIRALQRRPRYKLVPISRAVAVLILLIGIAVWRTPRKSSSSDLLFASMFTDECSSSSADVPFIKLSNGNVVSLNELPIGQFITDDGWAIWRVAGSRIVYQLIARSDDGDTTGHGGYHTFSTPYGQSWQVTLPDGSNVHLNAGSTLSYLVEPFRDKQQQRAAVLHGEAFFDVATRASHPFVIRTPRGMITVLGTRFDLRDYGNEDSCRVTLVSGAVRVDDTLGSFVLRPGMEASRHATGEKYTIRSADTSGRLAWRSESFNLDQGNIQQVMQQIVSWYGLKGCYYMRLDTLASELLGHGGVSKEPGINDLLRLLNEHTRLSFRLQNHYLFVSPKFTQ